jgi:hypothetical protein
MRALEHEALVRALGSRAAEYEARAGAAAR